MTSGGREVLKWIALALMTGDHVNKVLLHGAQPWLTDVARVVFPIFAVVFAWNLGHARSEAAGRSVRRLLIAGVLVQPFHALAFGYVLPLNILLTLALGVIVARSRVKFGLPLFVVASAFVDYQWAGVGLVVVALLFAEARGHWRAWVLLAAALVPLCWFNGNTWALLSLPLLWCLGRVRVDVPRWRWTFLGYYAVHLVILAAISGGMDAPISAGDAGGAVVNAGAVAAGVQVR